MKIKKLSHSNVFTRDCTEAEPSLFHGEVLPEVPEVPCGVVHLHLVGDETILAPGWSLPSYHHHLLPQGHTRSLVSLKLATQERWRLRTVSFCHNPNATTTQLNLT